MDMHDVPFDFDDFDETSEFSADNYVIMNGEEGEALPLTLPHNVDLLSRQIHDWEREGELRESFFMQWKQKLMKCIQLTDSGHAEAHVDALWMTCVQKMDDNRVVH